MTSRPQRKTTAVMRELLDFKGARAVDVGCGDGALVRFLAREGAEALGVECSEAQLAACRAAEPVDGERYLYGHGEALPLDDRSLDLVVYSNALHHVPVAEQEHALEEAARVLVPGGRLLVMEPLAEGDWFELTRSIEDETEVRAAAYAAIRAAIARGLFTEERELFYDAPFRYASYEAWKTHMLRVAPERADAVAARDQELAEGFAAIGEARDGAVWFEQPSRLNLLRKP
jgi:ubiquinone/menaquinone biosynthesis C-methylase UbiE